jgi:hypothetical protein
LKREVKLVDGLEERESSAARDTSKAGLLAVGNLFGNERGEELLVGPILLLRVLDRKSVV